MAGSSDSSLFALMLAEHVHSFDGQLALPFFCAFQRFWRCCSLFEGSGLSN